jgi:hypothetical protein
MAAVLASAKPIFIGPPIRGPIVEPNALWNIPMAVHPGITAYELITALRMPPSDNPDVLKIPVPPGPKIVDDPVEGEPPLNKEDKGDARFCRPVWSVDISCDSVDCTPVPVDVPVVWATAVACAANPAVLVVCGAAVNCVTFPVVAAELAA